MGVLICKGLRAVKGDFCLEVESLRLEAGEKIAVLGENGCGKTTLLQILAGLQDAQGEMLHGPDRWDRLSPRERARHMAYLPQESELLFNLSVGELLGLTLYPGLLLGGAARRGVLEATETAALERRAYASLSGGEKRRAMLARIFCRQADIYLLDEATAPLDMRHAAQLMRHVTGLSSTVVAAMHDLNLAARYFDRFLLMKGGKILFDRSREELEDAELEEIYGIGLVRCGDHFLPER